MYVCLIVLQQCYDSETWITFFYVFEMSLQKNVKFHVFGFSKRKKKRILEHWLLIGQRILPQTTRWAIPAEPTAFNFRSMSFLRTSVYNLHFQAIAESEFVPSVLVYAAH